MGLTPTDCSLGDCLDEGGPEDRPRPPEWSLVAGAPPGLTHRAETPGRSTHMPPRGLWTQLCCDTGEGLEAQVVWDRRVAALTSAVWWCC